MENLGFLDEKRVFSREAAQALVPIILRITSRTQKEIEHLSKLLPAATESSNVQYEVIQSRIESHLGQWQDHLRRLGAEPKGFWNVDFDSGDGYFCWKFPETEIRHWHGYRDGFLGRVEIDFRKSGSGTLRGQSKR